MNIPYKHYKNFKQFDDIDNFAEVHESFCKGSFTTSLNTKNSSTHQKVCTACGSVAYTEIGEFRDKVKIFFKGFIRNEKIGIERVTTEYAHKLYNNHCVACGTYTPSKTPSDLCPTCSNEYMEESSTDFDTHAESHAGSIKQWQQGNEDETGTEKERTIHLTIKRLRNEIKMYPLMTTRLRTVLKSFRDTSIEQAAENIKKANGRAYYAKEAKEEHARHTQYLKNTGFYATCDNLSMIHIEKEMADNPLTNTRLKETYKVYSARSPRKTDKKQSKQIVFTDVPLNLFECAISEKDKAPANAEIIEVTRQTKHILSPSWKTLNQYRKDKDWVKYTGAFMEEMNHTKPRAAMLEIIEKAKQHPVYLACFEVTGHCHRLLLIDWIKRLATV